MECWIKKIEIGELMEHSSVLERTFQFQVRLDKIYSDDRGGISQTGLGST